jgi:hypothetical protein
VLPLAESSALCEEFGPNFRNGYVQLVSERWEDAGLWLRQPGRADVEYVEVGYEETPPHACTWDGAVHRPVFPTTVQKREGRWCSTESNGVFGRRDIS